MKKQHIGRTKTQEPLIKTDPYFPVMEGELLLLQDNRQESERIIRYALNTYGYLVGKGILFRLCYLAEKLREYYDCVDNPKNKRVADVLIINSFFYCPFYRGQDGAISRPEIREVAAQFIL
jgi:hypothetical protein